MEPCRADKHIARPTRLKLLNEALRKIKALFLTEEGFLTGGNWLFLAWFDFVAAKVFLGFGEDDVLAQFLTVFLERQLLRGILSVFAGVVNALTGLFAHESDKFALFILFRHICYSLPEKCQSVNTLAAFS